mmetsp:Transcript_28755/g.51162  ORF Transcript_28755/g.51162 Transcript_28755/m.51162 type:complete len:174 (-) Transcript_28755:95-616(-)
MTTLFGSPLSSTSKRHNCRPSRKKARRRSDSPDLSYPVNDFGIVRNLVWDLCRAPVSTEDVVTPENIAVADFVLDSSEETLVMLRAFLEKFNARDESLLHIVSEHCVVELSTHPPMMLVPNLPALAAHLQIFTITERTQDSLRGWVSHAQGWSHFEAWSQVDGGLIVGLKLLL